MNAPGHPTRYKPEYRKPAHDCCLPGAGNPELAEFLGVAPRAIDNSIATPRAHRALQYHPWYFALLPTLYTGTKELSYPACRRLGPDEPARPISACCAWPSWAACRSPFADGPQDSNAGRAAIFRGIVSGRYFVLWPWRHASTRCSGSRRFTPASGAWLFGYSNTLFPRETVRIFTVSLLGCTSDACAVG